MSVGNIEVFDPATGNWKLYTERLEQYYLINDVKENLKVPTLMTLMGARSYELLVTLCAPRKPSTMTFTDVVQVMSDHLYPKPCILAERYNFRQRKQYTGEKVLEYVAELKKLAIKCDYKTKLDENLRDQLVYGLLCDRTRKRLFAQDMLDFGTAVAIAHRLEVGEETSSERNIDDEVPMSQSDFKRALAISHKSDASEDPISKCYDDDEVPISYFKSEVTEEYGLETSEGPSTECHYEDEVTMLSDESDSENEGTSIKRRGKCKPWIYMSKYSSLKDAEEFLKTSNAWSRNYTRNTKEGQKRFYRCNKVKKKGPQCAAERYLLYVNDSEDVLLYRTEVDHNHDEIGCREEYGIPELTKVMINSLVDRRLKPRAILRSLKQMEGIKVPTKRQINNYIAALKRSSICKTQVTESEKRYITLSK